MSCDTGPDDEIPSKLCQSIQSLPHEPVSSSVPPQFLAPNQCQAPIQVHDTPAVCVARELGFNLQVESLAADDTTEKAVLCELITRTSILFQAGGSTNSAISRSGCKGAFEALESRCVIACPSDAACLSSRAKKARTASFLC